MVDLTSYLTALPNDAAKDYSATRLNALITAIAAGINSAKAESFGFVANSPAAAAANSAAWTAMMATLRTGAFEPSANYPALRSVEFAAAAYHFAGTLDINKGTIDISGSSTSIGTTFYFPVNSGGIRIQYYDTSGSSGGAGVSHEHSTHTSLRNLTLRGPNADNFNVSNEGEYHGVQLRTTAYLQNVTVNGFQGDAFYMNAGALSPTYRGNANLTRFDNCFGRFCRNGISFAGADANAYQIIGGSFDNNRQWGHFEPDGQSLGGTIIGCHYDSNGITTAAPFSVVGHSGNWYCGIYGQEAWCSTNAPTGTTADNQGWAYISAGGVTTDRPAWVSAGSYRSGGSVLSLSINAVSLFLGCYGEGGYGLPQLDNGNWIIGGGLANFRVVGDSGSTLSYVNGYLVTSGIIDARKGLLISGGDVRYNRAEPTVYINATGSYASIAFESSGVPSGSVFQFSGDTYYDVNNAAKRHVFRINAIQEAELTSAGFNLAAGNGYSVNSTKVVGAQGAAVADATDAASAITQLNALLARARAHGLIAT